jgi:hypothetical protein
MALAALLLWFSILSPALAESDGAGFDGDELVLPFTFILGAIIMVGVVAFFVVRNRTKARHRDN